MKWKTIPLLRPQPLEKVGTRFAVSGLVPLSWLKTSFGIDRRILLDLLDVNAFTWSGGSIDIQGPNWFWRFVGLVPFYSVYQFHELDIGWLVKSEGRITIRLKAYSEDTGVFIPIIVKDYESSKDPDPALLEKHVKTGERVLQFKKDIEEYDRLVDTVYRRRDADTKESTEETNVSLEIAQGLYEALGSLEDEELEELNKKYKSALEWEGPRFGATVGQMNGFRFIVHSDDHGTHFHAIHKERGINARFSFPEIELLDYKGRSNHLRANEEKRIREFFADMNMFNKLDSEFKRRPIK